VLVGHGGCSCQAFDFACVTRDSLEPQRTDVLSRMLQERLYRRLSELLRRRSTTLGFMLSAMARDWSIELLLIKGEEDVEL
jgi:hypothetical protein